MGASFQANLASIHRETAELHACQKMPTDRRTAFRLYLVDSWLDKIAYLVYCPTVNDESQA